jgi:hypothetical protein
MEFAAGLCVVRRCFDYRQRFSVSRRHEVERVSNVPGRLCFLCKGGPFVSEDTTTGHAVCARCLHALAPRMSWPPPPVGRGVSMTPWFHVARSITLEQHAWSRSCINSDSRASAGRTPPSRHLGTHCTKHFSRPLAFLDFHNAYFVMDRLPVVACVYDLALCRNSAVNPL